MKIIYVNRDDFKKELIGAGAKESEINILKYLYSLNLTKENIKIIFIYNNFYCFNNCITASG